MSEMRHDPVQNRWVVIAGDRSYRPTDFIVNPVNGIDEANPFLEGKESETPPEIFAVRKQGSKANKPGWKVRVVPNKYPALTVDGDLDREGDGIYDKMQGVGAHEVVIETPDPEKHLAVLDPEHAFELGKVYRARLIDLMRDRRFRYVLIFRNHGFSAGSSLSHPHTQIVALPITPRTISLELLSSKQHFEAKSRCLFCDIIAQTIRDNNRIVANHDRFIAFTPYASRFPFEVCILPKYHQHDFRKITDDDLRDFMNIVQDVLQRLNVGLQDPPYNMMLHTAPNTECFDPRPFHWGTLPHDWHWHLEIVPRLTNVAGFEWGTGLFINPMPPEQAAEYLRGIILD